MKMSGMLQPQLRLSDDVVLNLVAPRIDRDLAEVEVVRRGAVRVFRTNRLLVPPALGQRAEDVGVGVVAEGVDLQLGQALLDFGVADLEVDISS